MCGSRSLHPSGGGQLEREELLVVYGCCDGFFSLHRSEGFGRGMAEALQLGVDVIARCRHLERSSGNTDNPCLVLVYHSPGGLAVGRVLSGGGV